MEKEGTYLQQTVFLSLSKNKLALISSFSVNSLRLVGLFRSLHSEQSSDLFLQKSQSWGTMSMPLSCKRIFVNSDCVNMLLSPDSSPSIRALGRLPQTRCLVGFKADL